jgi:hypothetical protein
MFSADEIVLKNIFDPTHEHGTQDNGGPITCVQKIQMPKSLVSN